MVFGVIGEMVDVFGYRLLKSDLLDKLVHEVQQVLDGSTSGSSRRKGGRQSRKRGAVNDTLGCRGRRFTSVLYLHPFCTETFTSNEDRERHVLVAHSGYTITDHAVEDVNAVRTAANEVDRSAYQLLQSCDGCHSAH